MVLVDGEGLVVPTAAGCNNAAARGDLHVHFDVVFPQRVDPYIREHLDRLLRHADGFSFVRANVS